MDKIRELLAAADGALSMIAVHGDAVFLLGDARRALRQAFDLASAREDGDAPAREDGDAPAREDGDA